MSAAPRATVVLFAAVLTLGLAGCAPAAPTAGPSKTASGPTSTPTPKYTQPAEPVSRIQIGCSDLTTPAAASTVLGLKLTSAPAYPIGAESGGTIESFRLVQNVALVQAGALDCSWTDDPSQNLNGLKVQVLAQGQAGWAAHQPLVKGTTIAGWADGAYYKCGQAQGQFCNYDVMTDGQWVELQFYSPTPPADFNAASRSLARTIVSKITAAAVPLPLWVPPASAHTVPTSCSSIFPNGSSISDLTRLTLQSAEQSFQFGVGGDVDGAALTLDGGLSCVWVTTKDTGDIQLVILPGGSWAWTADPAQSNASLTLKPVTGLGDAALVGCAAGECESHILFAGYWIAIDCDTLQSPTPVDQKILAAFG